MELDLILIGVTEAGIAPGEMAMDVLDETLFRYFSYHGVDSSICVMNTDNMSLSGETIDYGPCAFLDEYNPKKVFSSIDHNGRYAFNNQPKIAL